MSALGSSANFLDEHGYCTEENVNQFLANIHRIIPYDDPSLRCYQAALTRGQGNYVKLRRLRRFLGSHSLAQGANGIALQNFVRYTEEKEDLESRYITKISKPNNATIGIEDPEREADVGLKFLNLLRCPTFMYIYGIYRGYMPVVNDFGDIYLPSVNLPVDDPEQIYMMVEDIPHSISLHEFMLSVRANPRDMVGILLQILAALQLAQDRGRFMHLDLHSNNVLVQKDCPVEIRIEGQLYRFLHRAVIIDYGTASVNSPDFQSYYAPPPFNKYEDDPDEIEINIDPDLRKEGVYSPRAIYRTYYGTPGEFYPRADFYKLLCGLGSEKYLLQNKGDPAIYDELTMIFQDLFPDLGAYSENHVVSIPASRDPLGDGVNYYTYLGKTPFPENHLESLCSRYRYLLKQNPLPEKVQNTKPSYVYRPEEYEPPYDISFAIEGILESSYTREEKYKLLRKLLSMVNEDDLEDYIQIFKTSPVGDGYLDLIDANVKPVPIPGIDPGIDDDRLGWFKFNIYIERYILPRLIRKINDHDLLYGMALVIQTFRLLGLKERDPEDVLLRTLIDSQDYNQRWLESVLNFLDPIEKKIERNEYHGRRDRESEMYGSEKTYHEHLRFFKGISFHPPRNLREEFDFSDLNPRMEKRRRKYYCQRRR